MAIQKEAVEIHCGECGSTFRLWIPAETLREWEHGARINCVRCGAGHLIKKVDGTFNATAVKAPRTEAVAAPPPVHAAPPREVVHDHETAAASVQAEAPLRQPQPAAMSAPIQPPIQTEETPEEQVIENVLLVDDDKFSRQMAENTLANMGMHLLVVKNAAEALRIIKGTEVKLIITDLYLKNPTDPEALLDGEDLLKRLLEMGYNIPAIVTTGKDIIDDLVLDPKWFEMHVKGFIQKGNPFWAEELKLKINEVMYKG